MKARLVLILSALAAGCVAAAPPRTGTAPARPDAARGLAFAQQRCAECHGVKPDTLSPNPESPPFEDIANRNGLTEDTLGQFLIDSHNFPAAMDFSVTDAQARDLAAWMLTMRQPGHQPQR